MSYGCWPVRPWEDFYLTDSGYLSPKYHSQYNKWHRGEDINRKTGGDTDLGYPVQSMFPGKVIYANQPEGSWGGIVLIRTEEWLKNRISSALNISLEVLDMQYAHLMQISVKEGWYIDAGDHIGSIGKGGYNQYIAHLHLEARRRELPAWQPQGSDDAAKREVEEFTIPPKFLLNLPLTDMNETVANNRRTLDQGRLYVDDILKGRGTVIVNGIDDKVYVKVTNVV